MNSHNIVFLLRSHLICTVVILLTSLSDPEEKLLPPAVAPMFCIWDVAVTPAGGGGERGYLSLQQQHVLEHARQVFAFCMMGARSTNVVVPLISPLAVPAGNLIASRFSGRIFCTHYPLPLPCLYTVFNQACSGGIFLFFITFSGTKSSYMWAFLLPSGAGTWYMVGEIPFAGQMVIDPYIFLPLPLFFYEYIVQTVQMIFSPGTVVWHIRVFIIFCSASYIFIIFLSFSFLSIYLFYLHRDISTSFAARVHLFARRKSMNNAQHTTIHKIRVVTAAAYHRLPTAGVT